MQKYHLPLLLAQNLFRIPDYQRGYAWEEKQWNDFIEDIDALVDNEVTSHYTGTVVTYRNPDLAPVHYNFSRVPAVDVVDGQQRLTSSILYLSIILARLIRAGQEAYGQFIPTYLYSEDTCRLTPGNETAGIFSDLIRYGAPNTAPATSHQARLVTAHARFSRHLDEQAAGRGGAYPDYLKELFSAITSKLVFTHYAIEMESEIGMTFELMNSRGKDLSVLELLKNYLMHWVHRNAPVERKASLANLINRHWKDTYSNIGATHGRGREDQCLRVAWTLFCNHSPKNWDGYQGFKDDQYIPLRNFSPAHPHLKSREQTQDFLIRFTEGLSLVSNHYAAIVYPSAQRSRSEEEFRWLTKIQNTGSVANFLPLLIAARIALAESRVEERDYLDLLRAVECYAYRVFLWEAKRSNSGQSRFFHWADELFRGRMSPREISAAILGLAEYHSPSEPFAEWNSNAGNWYQHNYGVLRYTLYEYELHLLNTEGKGKAPALSWADLMKDSSIEHILPQNPAEGSVWLSRWTSGEMEKHCHDIGNLVLTQNNSNYRNFDFSRKKGQPGVSPSYSHSDIRQERDVSAFEDWTPVELMERRGKIVDWILERWKTGPVAVRVSAPVAPDAPEA